MPDQAAQTAPARRRRKEVRPAEITDAAFAAFCEHGYAATRLDDVARRAGIAKGTIYLYFDNKIALFEAVMESKLTETIGAVEALVDDYDGDTTVLLQMLLTKAYANLVQSDAKLILRIIIGESQNFPELRQLYYDVAMKRGLSLLTRVIRRGIDRGELRDGPAAQQPRLIMGPCVMAAIWSMTFDAVEPLDIDRYFAGHVDLLLNGLRA